MNIKVFCRLLLILLCFILTSCTAITRQIQSFGNTSNRYPAAQADTPQLEQPAFIDLSAYKSVHTRHHRRQNMAIALAASGGGYRAANLTVGVMLGLEKIKSPGLNGNLLENVDYYSSVSGGGFGIGYYLTQLHNHIDRYGDDRSHPFSLRDHMQDVLLHDQNVLTTDKVCCNPLGMDLTEFLFFGEQRGYALEKRLSDTILKTPEGSLTLGDIYVPKGSRAKVKLPYWATNSTIYQNAGLFPFTPDVLKRYRVSRYYHNNMTYQIPSSYDAFGVPVSVGVTASGSVPFAVPPTTLTSDSCKDKCYLQLLDGGLSDNLGVYTALNFLLMDKSKIKMLIVVDAYKATASPYSQNRLPPENMSVAWRVATASTDANHARVKPNINLITTNLLCGAGANNVIVVYLDLSQYPNAQRIGTQLSITPQNQKLLLEIGQKLVAENPTLQKFIKKVADGKFNLGQCQKG